MTRESRSRVRTPRYKLQTIDDRLETIEEVDSIAEEDSSEEDLEIGDKQQVYEDFDIGDNGQVWLLTDVCNGPFKDLESGPFA